MAANINPIFGRTPDVQLSGAVLGPSAQSGTVPSQGIDANTVSLFQADATEGSWVQQIILKPVGTTASTVVRIYVCSATGAFTPGTTNTLSNTSLIREMTLPSVSASTTSAQIDNIIPINLPLPAGWRILVGFSISTGAAGNGYQITTVGMKY